MKSRQKTSQPLDPTLYDELAPRMAALLEQRATVAPALRGLAAEFPSSGFRHQLAEVAELLESDASVATLLNRPERLDVLLPLIAPNQDAATGGASLHELLLDSQRADAARRQRRRVFAYPLAVCLVLLPVFVFLLTVVVPVYSSVFTSFNMELPALTATIVWLSQGMLATPLLAAAAIVVAISGIYLFSLLLSRFSNWYHAAFGYITDGSSRELLAMAAFIRRLRGALLAGLPVPSAVKLAGYLSERRSLRLAAPLLASAVDSSPLAQHPIAQRFPATLLFALTVSPSPPAGAGVVKTRLLDELAETYLERVAQRADWNSGVVGQVAIAAVGLLVGVVLIAMLLPLVSLVNGLTG